MENTRRVSGLVTSICRHCFPRIINGEVLLLYCYQVQSFMLSCICYGTRRKLGTEGTVGLSLNPLGVTTYFATKWILICYWMKCHLMTFNLSQKRYFSDRTSICHARILYCCENFPTELHSIRHKRDLCFFIFVMVNSCFYAILCRNNNH